MILEHKVFLKTKACWTFNETRLISVWKIQVVWFTAIFPYVVLAILFVRGITLPGAEKGIDYYLRPNITMLSQPSVWQDAATQVFSKLLLTLNNTLKSALFWFVLGIFLPWSRFWSTNGIRVLQQLPQQCLYVSFKFQFFSKFFSAISFLSTKHFFRLISHHLHYYKKDYLQWCFNN